MKKAIVFLMVLGVFTFNVFTANVASTEVEFTFSSDDLADQNFAFIDSTVTVDSMEDARVAVNNGNITMAASATEGSTTIKKDFNFIWYYYSADALKVTLKVGAMQNSGKTEELSWTITPSSAFGNNNNTASYLEITAPDAGDSTKNQDVVTVASTGVMKQSWGNIKLAGVVDANGATPGTYTSAITAEISAN